MSRNEKTVIIADDHETVVMYLSILMRRMGFSVIAARNGEEVLNMLEAFHPDLVITDRKMPIVDGLTTFKRMKGNPRVADIPVIMVTAHFEQQAHDEFMALGGVGFLTKPINILELHHLLRECVRYSQNIKRKNMRVSYGCKVMVMHEGRQQEFYAVTLSEQGIYLRTQTPLPVGARVEVLLRLQAEQIATFQGAVIYQKNISDDINKLDPGMAIKFDDCPTVHAEALKSHIMELLAGDLVDEQQEKVIEAPVVKTQLLQDKLSELKENWRTN